MSVRYLITLPNLLHMAHEKGNVAKLFNQRSADQLRARLLRSRAFFPNFAQVWYRGFQKILKCCTQVEFMNIWSKKFGNNPGSHIVPENSKLNFRIFSAPFFFKFISRFLKFISQELSVAQKNVFHKLFWNLLSYLEKIRTTTKFNGWGKRQKKS